MKKFIFGTCVLPIVLYKLVVPKYSSSYQGLLQMQIFQFKSITLVSQGHKNFNHNVKSYIYCKEIQLTRK